MKVAVFTYNQPRHFALLRALSTVADEVIAVMECGTLFPGRIQGFYSQSDTMDRYFGFVREAEAKVFGTIGWLPSNVRVMPLHESDINLLPVSLFDEALDADRIIVYSASYLRDPLCAELVRRNAVNIHVGVSPYYRGASCNFWAMHDRRYDLLGATIHRLSAGLDSGPILFHAFPKPVAHDPFDYGMLCVKAAQIAVAQTMGTTDWEVTPVPQDRSSEIRYATRTDFSDKVASTYLANLPSPKEIYDACARRSVGDFIRPQIIDVG